MRDETTPIDDRPDHDVRPSRGAGVFKPCPTCRAELGELPAGARFCPWCGHNLQAPSSFPVLPTPVLTPPGERRSPILRGFGRAMYLLGRRYERALGAQRNPTEALRCYDKASKLGYSADTDRPEDSTGEGGHA